MNKTCQGDHLSPRQDEHDERHVLGLKDPCSCWQPFPPSFSLQRTPDHPIIWVVSYSRVCIGRIRYSILAELLESTSQELDSSRTYPNRPRKLPREVQFKDPDRDGLARGNRIRKKGLQQIRPPPKVMVAAFHNAIGQYNRVTV